MIYFLSLIKSKLIYKKKKDKNKKQEKRILKAGVETIKNIQI